MTCSCNTPTVFVITHHQRGEEEAGLLSVHLTKEGAVKAIHDWVRDYCEDGTTIEEFYADFSCDPAEGDICTEDDLLGIVEMTVDP